MSGKKLLLAGFAVMLLIGIPLTLFLVQQQQQTSTEAQKATVLSFEPASTPTNPIQKSVGDLVPLNIVVNPGTNLVGWIRVVIQYDQTKLATVSATPGGTQPFTINPSTSFSFFNGPVYSAGRIEAELSVGSDPTKALQSQVTLATVNFRALSGTGDTPTTVSYTTESQATSLGAGDQASEDVLSTTTPASIVIAGDGTTTPTPTPTGPGGAATPTPTTPATVTPTPTTPAAITPTPTTPGGTGGTNQLPVCSSLNVDRATTGTAPLSLTFTANGTDSDGTISRVTFNFGDGAPTIVTVGGGIGTNTVAVQNAHTYTNPGTYAVTATLTDSSGGTSAAGGCSQTVTVQAAGTSGGTTGGGTTSGGTTGTTNPGTIPATGPGDMLVGIGAVAGALSLLGAILFFAL